MYWAWLIPVRISSGVTDTVTIRMVMMRRSER